MAVENQMFCLFQDAQIYIQNHDIPSLVLMFILTLFCEISLTIMFIPLKYYLYYLGKVKEATNIFHVTLLIL